MSNVLAGRMRKTALALAASGFASLALSGPAMADGQFVIGDQSPHGPGAQVTFWGAQWWKDNAVTGGAPAAFKGWVDNVQPVDLSSSACLGPWTSLPGNSSAPPASVAGTITVLVTNSVVKNGSAITGYATDAVQVLVDPGYAGDPGHPGTGTVVGDVCGGVVAG